MSQGVPDQSALPLAKAAEVQSSINTIYIFPSSHWDFCFIRTPEDEQAAMKPHLDAVLTACRRDSDFRWSIESIWQLEAWMARTSDKVQIAEMKSCIASGQIEVSATWGSMHTEFMGTEELNRLDDASKRLSAVFGLRGDMAMENDVPGFSLRLPQVLARGGVRYLVNGSNTAFGGGTSISPGVAPFYWASPDGSRVLLWTTSGKEGGYTEGMTDYYLDPAALDPYQHTPFYPKEWQGLPDEEITSRGVQKIISHYTDAGFHGHSIAVLFMHDGIGPDYAESLLSNVRRWNADGRLPHLRVATPHEYFASYTPQDLASMPLYSGDWSGLWSESKTSSPAMSADARFIQETLPMAEEAASLAIWNGASQSYPTETFQHALTNLMRYDEHNGAGNAGWPKVLSEEEVNRSNREYATYLKSAKSQVEQVLGQAVPKLVTTRKEPSAERYLVVTNLCSWRRTDVVTIASISGNFTVTDAASHEAIPAQRTSPTSLTFTAHDVPPFGYKTYMLKRVQEDQWTVLTNTTPHAENIRYFVDVDSTTGEIIRVVDKKNLKNIFSGHAPTALRSGEPARQSPVVQIVHISGPVEDSIRISRRDSWAAETNITLPHDLDEVRFEEVFDRAEMPFVANGHFSDRYEVRFPFAVSGSTQEWIDDGIGFHRMPQDQLAGTRLDGAVPRFSIALSSDGSAGSDTLLFAQKESFFTRPGKNPGDIDVTAMTKSDQGETRDHGVVTFATFEPGYPTLYDFHFRVSRKNTTFKPVEGYRFGKDGATPLLARLLAPHLKPLAMQRSYLTVGDDNVVVDDIRPVEVPGSSEYIIRLQEIAGTETVTSLATPSWSLKANLTDLTGTQILSPVSVTHIHLGSHETVTLRVKLSRDAK